MPKRSRALLGASLDLCRKFLADTLSNVLDEFAKTLFHLSETSRKSEQQQNYFLSSRELSNNRAQILPRYLEVIEDFLACYDQRASNAAGEATAALTVRQGLSLVETGELEESLALQEFVARAEVRHSQSLYALGHRFAVLCALPALDAQALPVGPAQLGRALRHAAAVLAISAEHRVLLYRTFDQHAAKDIGALYDALNDYFVEQHILKNLRAQTTRSTKERGAAAAAKAADGATEATPEQRAQEQQADAPSSPGQRPQQGGQSRGARPQPAGNWPSPDAFEQTASSGFGYGAQGGRGHGAMPGPAYEAPAGDSGSWHDSQSLADQRDVELFSSLRELLAGSRGHVGAPGTGEGIGGYGFSAAGGPAPGAFVPSFDDVQGVLGALQAKPAPPHVAGSETRLRGISQLKQDLLQELRELSPDHQMPQLAGEDSDTIDLVGMLFDHMAGGLPRQSGTRHLLSRLQVPLLRVALRDKSFFTRKTHPARQLLNAVAETGERWMDGSDATADSDLLNKLQFLLDRLSTEFDGDLGVIEDLLGDLSDHVQTLTRKAEVAERRQVDAAIGREKLAMARETAAAAVAERISSKPPGAFVRTLLEEAWADVLALTLLRQGESSPAYQKRIEVADRLIESSAAAENGDGPIEPHSEELREEIENGLQQVGYHEEDIQAVVKRLFVSEDAANEDMIDEAELAEKLASQTRLGKEITEAEKAAAKRRAALDLTAAEKKTLEDLKKLPFGTWFEFVTNQQGNRVRKKMAWASKLTGRCMFVNQRGSRSDDTTLEELARDVTRGQVFVAHDTQESFVDRAWGAIVSSLKRIGTFAGAFAPPPAEPIA